MKKIIEIIALIYFIINGIMPLCGAFVYAFIVDSYNWIAAIVGLFGSIIYSAYFINHFTISKNPFLSLILIFVPTIIVISECYISGTHFSTYFLKTAFINLGALALATSIPFLLMSFVNVAVLPGALVLASMAASIIWLLYFTAGYLQPNDINQSFLLLLSAVIIETILIAAGFFGISNSISEKANNIISKYFKTNGNKIFQMYKPELIVTKHDQIMTAIGATSFVLFFVLIII